jgi:hypothetical protein
MQLDDKLSRIDDRLQSIERVALRQQDILEEHQRRSLANEQSVVALNTQIEEFKRLSLKMEGGVKTLFAILTVVEILSKFWH